MIINWLARRRKRKQTQVPSKRKESRIDEAERALRELHRRVLIIEKKLGTESDA